MNVAPQGSRPSTWHSQNYVCWMNAQINKQVCPDLWQVYIRLVVDLTYYSYFHSVNRYLLGSSCGPGLSHGVFQTISVPITRVVASNHVSLAGGGIWMVLGVPSILPPDWCHLPLPSQCPSFGESIISRELFHSLSSFLSSLSLIVPPEARWAQGRLTPLFMIYVKWSVAQGHGQL